MIEESVHNTHFSEHLAFEVTVDRSEALSLIKQIADKSKDLAVLSNRLTPWGVPLRCIPSARPTSANKWKNG